MKFSRSIYKILFRRQSNDMSKFKEALIVAKRIAFMSGAGLSAESGIPTYRRWNEDLFGADECYNLISSVTIELHQRFFIRLLCHYGSWRRYSSASLDTAQAFKENPSLVWQFYHHRREVAARTKPNLGHIAIASYEAKHGKNQRITIITQNIDGLHARAGTKNLVELHGSLFKTRCTKCNEVLLNTDSQICEALANKGAPGEDVVDSDIPIDALPHCKKPNCKGLLRPHVVWFRESLDTAVFEIADEAMSKCDVCLVIGTSSLVYPAAGMAPLAAVRGAIVAEFNIETTSATSDFSYYFDGPCAKSLMLALSD